jgi:phosphoribosylformylglycinamidine cyclo-ligase
VPAIFQWLQKLGGIDSDEMERVFNMGIGLVLVVSGYYEATITGMLADAGLAHWKLGQIIAGDERVVWKQ